MIQKMRKSFGSKNLLKRLQVLLVAFSLVCPNTLILAQTLPVQPQNSPIPIASLPTSNPEPSISQNSPEPTPTLPDSPLPVLNDPEPQLIIPNPNSQTNAQPNSQIGAPSNVPANITANPKGQISNNITTDNSIVSNGLETDSTNSQSQKPNLVTATANAYSAYGPTPMTTENGVKVDQKSGGLSYEYPIETPPGRAGIEPDLKLVYNSSDKTNDSIFGYAWGINIPYIERTNKTGVRDLFGQDFFTSSIDGELVRTGATTFAPRVEEDTFKTYSFSNNTWTLTDKNGVNYTFGASTDTRQDDPNNSTHIYKWMLERVEDMNGNYMTYEYTKDGGQIYPKKIYYTFTTKSGPMAEFSVEFHTTNRSDVVPNYARGFLVHSNYLIDKISIYEQSTLKSYYDFTYTTGDNGFRTLLETATHSAYNSLGTLVSDPATKFSYTKNVRASVPTNSTGIPTVGFAPIKKVNSDVQIVGCTIKAYINVPCAAQFADINGDGLMDYVAASADWNSYGTATYTYNERIKILLNTGTDFVDSGWELPERTITGLSTTPGKKHITLVDQMYAVSTQTVVNGFRLVDYNGDGRADILWQPYAGVYNPKCSGSNWVGYINNGHGWDYDSSMSSPASCSLSLQNDITQFADINGDGLVDIYVGKDSSFGWGGGFEQEVYINQGGYWAKDGTWTFDNKGATIEWPAIFRPDSDNTRGQVKFGDINNDGLPDLIVSIRTFGKENGSGIPKTSYGKGWHPTDVGEWFYAFINTGHNFEYDSSVSFPENNLSFSKIKLSYPTNHNSHVVFSAVDEYNLGNPLRMYNNFFDFTGDGQIDLMDSDDSVYGYKDGATWTKSQFYSDTMTKTTGTGFILDPWDITLDLNGDNVTDIFFGDSSIGNAINQNVVTDLLSTVTNSLGGQTSITYKGSAQYTDSSGKNLNKDLPIIFPTISQIKTDDGMGNVKTENYTYQGGKYWTSDLYHKKFMGFGIVTDDDGNKITKTYYHQGDGTNMLFGEYDDQYSKIGKPYRVETYDQNGKLLDAQIYKWDRYNIATDHDFVYLADDVHQIYSGTAHRDIGNEYSYDSATGNLTQKKSDGEILSDNMGFIINDIGNDAFTTDYSYSSNGFVKPTDEYTRDFNKNFFKRTKYDYDFYGNKTSEKNYVNTTTLFTKTKTYNSFGLVDSGTDEAGNTTNYSYDSKYLNVETKTDALGNKTTYSYDYNNGQVLSTTDANGLVTENLYDGFGRILSQKIDGNIVSTFSYTDTPISISSNSATYVKKTDYRSSSDSTDSYIYKDGFGKTIKETTQSDGANWAVVDTMYNSRGLAAQKSLPFFVNSGAYASPTTNANLYTNYSYDALDRPTTVANSVGSTNYSYNLWDTTITDPNGNKKTLQMDAFGRVWKVIENIGGSAYTTEYLYNSVGNLLQIVDALGNVRSFHYDGRGQRTYASDLHDPGDNKYGVYAFWYDPIGNLIRMTTPNSATVYYTYDALGRPLSENSSGIKTDYSYDSCTNGIGRICEVATPDVDTTYSYTKDGKVSDVSKTISGTNYIIEYSYDWLGNILTTSYPDGGIVTNTFTKQNLPYSVMFTDSNQNDTYVVQSATYSPNAQVENLSYGNGTSVENNYDSAHMYHLKTHTLLDNANNVLLSRTYGYDSNGNVVEIYETDNANTKTTDYTYDELDRLISAIAKDANGTTLWNKTFSYNILGNITKKDGNTYLYDGNTLANNYANPHAPTKISSQNISYDKNGNITDDGARTNFWNYKNQLSMTVKSGATFKYFYDNAGERIRYETPSGNMIYPNSNYYSDDTSGNTVTNTDINFGNSLAGSVQMDNNGTATVYFTDTDQVKSNNYVTDINGTNVEFLDYYPFGEISTHTTTGAYSEHKKFGGHILDDDTNYQYFGARYYDSAMGAFINEDPSFWATDNLDVQIVDPQSWNSFTYARDNPIRNIDPDGRFSVLGSIKSAISSVASVASKILGMVLGNNNQTQVTNSTQNSSSVSVKTTTWDPVTDKRIRQLDSRLQQPATNFINNTENELNIQLRVSQSYRSNEEQDKKYAQGRTEPGNIITKAKGGQSYHNYGLAFDVIYVKNEKEDWSTHITKNIADIAIKQGFEWGGNWPELKDDPHFQMTFGQSWQSLLKASKQKK